MSIERVFHCDESECEAHVHTLRLRPEADFLVVSEDGSAANDLHFCTWDCVLKYAATKPPSEIILAED